MPKHRSIRVRGVQREPLDVDLMAQLVVLLGRQLAAESAAAAADVPDGGTAPTTAEAPSA